MVYIHWHQSVAYPVVVEADFEGRPWLVMISLDGMMESAFIVENPTIYLNKLDFERVGLLLEVFA